MKNKKPHISLTNQSKIYIYCQANLRTGGPEALHQLRYYMEMCGLNAYIVYTGIKEGILPTPDRYLKYFTEKKGVATLDEIEDVEENCVIVSESQTCELRKVKYAQKVIWWLSVVNRDTNYFGRVFNLKTRLKRFYLCHAFWRPYVRPYPRDKAINICASKFAYEYVTKTLGLPAFYMIEPISKEFLDRGVIQENSTIRENSVAYNPSKPSKIMDKLLNRKDINFIPIKNMTPEEISDLFRKVKLYVDFGNFPGPERLPKEAVYNGANILVAYKNAAKNDFDIAIPEQYKIKDYNNEELVVKLIKEMLTNYDKQYNDFEKFRVQIDKLESNFIVAIKTIFNQNG